jgi:hypothetical protein
MNHRRRHHIQGKPQMPTQLRIVMASKASGQHTDQMQENGNLATAEAVESMGSQGMPYPFWEDFDIGKLNLSSLF